LYGVKNCSRIIAYAVRRFSLTVYAAQGNARESMALLWRESAPRRKRVAPGPKPGLSIDSIIEAAISIADADGMDGLSMRSVGDRLDRTAMSLYTYVPNKSLLLDLMFDHALGELPASYKLEDGWRLAFDRWSRDLCEFYIRHPWMLDVSQTRPVLGPNEYRMLETVFVILESAGLDAHEVPAVANTVTHFVRGAALMIAEARTAQAVTGLSDEEWWIERFGVQAEFVPDFADRFPVISRMFDSGAFNQKDEDLSYFESEARQTFDSVLDLILNGVEATISM
jgi:AcrR family transcriptional regulator